MKKQLYIGLLSISLLLGASCNKNDVGGVKIDANPSLSEITIDEFPMPQMGIEGFNTVTYPPGFSFKVIDETIYDHLVSKAYNNNLVSVKLRFLNKDNYGKMVLGEWKGVGTFDSNEAKKYADFAAWNSKYGLFKLLTTANDDQDTSNITTNPNSEQRQVSQESIYGDTETDEERNERLEIFEPIKGVNTTQFNQSEENLLKLNWCVIEDVFFKEHVEFYPGAMDATGLTGRIKAYRNIDATYDQITIENTEEGTVDVYLHSLTSGKSIIRPRNSSINVGAKIEFWGTYLTSKDKTIWYLNQAVIK